MANNILSQEDIAGLVEQNEANKSLKCPINICGRITYGFDTNIISMNLNDPINKKSYEEALKKVKGWEDYQIPVGYIIHNASIQEIKDISVPSYKLNALANRYEGTIEKVSLKPNDRMMIPTEWLMILLIKLGTGLQVGNGEFKKICDTSSDDCGEKLRNVYFVPDINYAEFFDNVVSNFMIGCYRKISQDELSDNLEIIIDEAIERFAYLMNVYEIDHSDGSTSNKNITKSLEFFRKIVNN